MPANGRTAALSRRSPLVSVVMPCLEEVAGVALAVSEAMAGLALAGNSGEIIVVDNGSTDGSVIAAQRAGATALREPRRGFGAVVRRGLWEARGEVMVLADADGSYDLRQFGALVQRVLTGADLVVGARFGTALDAGAMPWLHRRIGTPAPNLMLQAATGSRSTTASPGSAPCAATA